PIPRRTAQAEDDRAAVGVDLQGAPSAGGDPDEEVAVIEAGAGASAEHRGVADEDADLGARGDGDVHAGAACGLGGDLGQLLGRGPDPSLWRGALLGSGVVPGLVLVS